MACMHHTVCAASEQHAGAPRQRLDGHSKLMRGGVEEKGYSGLRRAPSACGQSGGQERSGLDVVPVRRCSKVDYCYCPRRQLLITEDVAF
ncbi:hypothetical protein LMG29542_00667 [Paraburkholderia humisilvae]|uniref:Uncharacterized protein n=1 Tax=Paraburkholderia humisilvae TaxID=627669 RepID=A0A6J5D2A3_9BURK|nr:hypothetical protein LMG29542_00667 [Paraburkholderia humisilvae]